MIVIVDVSETEIKRLNELVGFPSDAETADSDEVATAIHTLIEVC